jgi:hypothetical protein
MLVEPRTPWPAYVDDPPRRSPGLVEAYASVGQTAETSRPLQHPARASEEDRTSEEELN